MTDIAMAALNTELPIISIGQSEQIARQTLARIQSIQTRDSSASAGRKKSHQSSSSPRSPPPLPRPNILAAHAYYLDNADPIESSTEAMQRRISLVDGTLFPRRHSVLTPAGGLDMRLEGFKFPPMERSLPTLSEPALSDDNIKIKKPEDDAPNAAETNTTDCKPSEIIRVPPHQTLPPVVPFEYTHDHLREWGYAYLGNAATADVFVNAVSLRRPSLAVLNKDDLNVKNERTPSNMVTVRARVLPKVKSRKPFMIQRRMDIEDLRAGIPKVTNVDEESPMSPLTTNNPRRSTRLRPGSGDLLRSSKSPSLSGKSSIPIHIEYALHYLPVLAALMLSGHVRKGDTIDLPMPQPEDWRAVISYIYTGSGDVSAAMRENILFLAGRV